jgi:hypothetical protein
MIDTLSNNNNDNSINQLCHSENITNSNTNIVNNSSNNLLDLSNINNEQNFPVNNSNTISLSNKIAKHNNLKILHWNCNHLKNKIEFIENLIEKYDPDVISLNEIKCNEIMKNVYLNFNNMTSYTKLRNEKGGGVALLVKSNIEQEEIKLTLPNEIIGVKLKINNKFETNIFTLYNPPNNLIKKDLFDIISKHKNFILIGDLNAKVKANDENIVGKQLIETLADYMIVNNSNPNEYSYYETKKTFEEECYYKSNLDLVISSPNIANKINTITHLYYDLFGSLKEHIPILVDLNIIPSRIVKSSINKSIVLYENADWPMFNKFTRDIISYNYIEGQCCLDEFFHSIVDTLNFAKKHSIPSIKNESNNRSLPSHIVAIKRERNKMQRLVKQQKDNTDIDPEDLKCKKNKLKILDSLVCEAIKDHKNKNWNEFVNKCDKQLTSSKRFWNKINLVKNGKRSITIPTLIQDGLEHKTDSEKANLFASRLKNTFNEQPDETKTFNNNNKSLVEHDVKHWLDTNLTNLKSVPITFDETKNLIKKLNNKTSVDQFGINNKMLKNSSYDMIGYLTLFFNECMIQNHIPLDCKWALITMIPKKNISNDPSNFRPISTTSVIMKLFERIMVNRINSYLKSKHILIKNQSGFRANRQTKDNLFFMTQKIQEAFNAKKKCCALFYDIKAAFDKVWHCGLLYKLIKIGIPAYIIYWTALFLKDRAFKVKVNDYVSEKFEITCGVPQGAVSSPQFFGIYINDLPCLFKRNSKYSLLFADDLVDMFFFKHFKNGKNKAIENQINVRTTTISKWMDNWRLRLAPQKCNYIIFSNCKKFAKEESFNIKLRTEKINQDKNPKFLGVIFDKSLTFNKQIEHLKKTCNSRLNILKILNNKWWGIQKNTLIKIYMSLVGSILDYSSFFYASLPYSSRWDLQKIQNKCFKCIFKTNNLNDLYDKYKENGIKTLNTRSNELKCNYLTKALHENNNELIKDLCQEYVCYKKKCVIKKQWSNKMITATLLDIELDDFDIQLDEPTQL